MTMMSDNLIYSIWVTRVPLMKLCTVKIWVRSAKHIKQALL